MSPRWTLPVLSLRYVLLAMVPLTNVTVTFAPETGLLLLSTIWTVSGKAFSEIVAVAGAFVRSRVSVEFVGMLVPSQRADVIVYMSAETYCPEYPVMVVVPIAWPCSVREIGDGLRGFPWTSVNDSVAGYCLSKTAVRPAFPV